MQEEINQITLPLPLWTGTVNSYLVRNENGFLLIDTGASKNRSALETAIEKAGCSPGDLKLIILTHGDFDHSGSAAHLREKFNTPIAMHYDDLGMVEQGDMFWNRNRPNLLLRTIIPAIFRFGPSKRFSPDLFLEDDTDISEYGFGAKVVKLTGHSKGSIGLLTTAGDLICGDLFENTKYPRINPIMDDIDGAETSVEKLKQLEIKTVYPGHGNPFLMKEFAAHGG